MINRVGRLCLAGFLDPGGEIKSEKQNTAGRNIRDILACPFLKRSRVRIEGGALVHNLTPRFFQTRRAIGSSVNERKDTLYPKASIPDIQP